MNPAKSKIQPPKPFYCKIDPRDKCAPVMIPKIEYQYVAVMNPEVVFRGNVVVIPKCALFFLTDKELKLFVTIMEREREIGECDYTVSDFAKMLQISTSTASTLLYKLRKFGLLLEKQDNRKGNGRLRKINYKALQRLNDLFDGEDIALYHKFRSICTKFDIANMTKKDIENVYGDAVLHPDHDPEEEEEYD